MCTGDKSTRMSEDHFLKLVQQCEHGFPKFDSIPRVLFPRLWASQFLLKGHPHQGLGSRSRLRLQFIHPSSCSGGSIPLRQSRSSSSFVPVSRLSFPVHHKRLDEILSKRVDTTVVRVKVELLMFTYEIHKKSKRSNTCNSSSNPIPTTSRPVI